MESGVCMHVCVCVCVYDMKEFELKKSENNFSKSQTWPYSHLFSDSV